ncbi:hypothetical protein PYW07_000818 [Mythimna separata]|uniref:Protein quiver n=1 Tax=Mythimna separata TaxID=271217 RepID=A0AAD7YTB9_MYTSE|nr:hypothetical protein PYW07_000818 [Mythimna separata]
MEFLISKFMVLMLLWLTVKQASCLKCYECHSFPTATGRDDAGSCKKLNMIRTCPESDSTHKSVCRKFTFQSLDKKHTYEKRSCGVLGFENIEEYDDANNERRGLIPGTPVSSMICNTDLCNSAVDNPSTKLILFLSAVFSVTFYKYVLY